jgi:putative glutamine amidotransferase
MPQQRPLVGLNCRYEGDPRFAVRDRIALYVPYCQALLSAGALPVVVPTTDDRDVVQEYLARLDGLLFTGGEDVPPQAYGQQGDPRTHECHPSRFSSDQVLAELILQREMPVLAICMGMQLVNAVYGGTLIQHIEGDVQHEAKDRGNDRLHLVVIEEESLLHHIVGASEIEVNSSHHQAIDKLAPGLRVLGWAPDGIVEAMQMTDREFFLGVQWHPERIVDRPEQRRIFEAFVTACQQGS